MAGILKLDKSNSELLHIISLSCDGDGRLTTETGLMITGLLTTTGLDLI